jgi:plasmid stabilization system protein ParE
MLSISLLHKPRSQIGNFPVLHPCEVLPGNPRLGHKRLDLTDEPVLFRPVRGRYLVIYEPQPESLKIVRILHGSRDASFQL